MNLLVMLVALLLQVPAPTNRGTASIEGIVVDKAMKPVAGADVIAFWDPSPMMYRPEQLPRGFSDSNGRFVISNLEPGGYQVSVSAAGFVRQSYGASGSGQAGSTTGTRIVLTPGQTVSDITVRLTKASTIAGRVISNTGEPLTGMDVVALRIVYDSNGWRRLVAESGGTQSDDRGEYRIAGIGPGRYYIRAASSNSTIPAALRASMGRSPVSSGSYAAAYYPGETDVSTASLVEIGEDDEVRAINIALSRQKTYGIRGHIVDANGKPPARPMIGVIPIRPDFVSSVGASVTPYCGTSPECINPTGAFELSDVAPGSYWVRAQISVPSTPELRQLMETPGADPALLPQPKLAVAAVEVVTSDVDNVELKFYASLSIAGTLSIDDASPALLPGADAIKIGLREVFAGSLGPVRPSTMDPNGRFSFGNLTPAEYRLDISSLPQDLFALEAHLGNTNALSESLRILAPESEQLNIKLSSKSGRVKGVVIDSNSKTVSRATVVLVPTDVKDRPDIFKTAISDEDGRFVISGIAPGDYTAYSWENIEGYSYFNAAFVREYEPHGKPVHVAATSIEDLQITRIPAKAN